MKIVLVNQAHPSFGGPGGAERSVKTLAEGLARRGHEVISLAMAQRADTGHLSESGVHSEHLIAGVRTILLGKVSKSRTEIEMMRALIQQEKPDVVHTNTFWHNVDLWREVARLGVPIVHSLREYKLPCRNNMYRDGAVCGAICPECELMARLGRERSRLVTSVVGISDYVLARHLDLGFFAETANRTVIYNPVAPAPQAERPPRDGDDRLTLGYLGRLHPTKGVGKLIDTLMDRPDGNVRLVLAGEVQDEEIADKIAYAEGDPRFTYLGFVEPAELFSQIDVLVVPSAWPEPFGRIVVESLQQGIPVLASRSGGLPELVEQGETGWIFDGDRASLDAAIDSLIAQRARIPEMRAACLEAAERFEPDVIATQYERLYERTAGVSGDARQRAARTEIPSLRRILNLRQNGRARAKPSFSPRVLVVTGEFPKLSETFVMNHITGLIDEGADVSILAERRGGEDQWHADAARYRLIDRTIWYGIPPELKRARDYLSNNARAITKGLNELLERSSVVNMPPPLDELSRALIEEQARTEVKLRLFHAAEMLVRAGKTFDIVHCHFGHRGLLARELRRMGALTGRIAVSFHGIDMTEHLQRRGVHVYDSLKGDADLLLPISNFFRERLLHLGLSPRNTHVHHVGIDCGKFRFRERRAGEDEKLSLLTVGRLVPKKGVDFALRALGLMRERGKLDRITYDIIGDGPDRRSLETLASKLGIHDHVTFHGPAPHEEVAAHMDRAHVLVAPSVSAPNGDMEGIPTTIMEAMAAGMPVISTLHSGIPELVQDDVSGFLCPERDFRQLADKIEFLDRNRELWPGFGRNGRQIVERDFNIAVQNRKAMRMYASLLGEDSGEALSEAG